MRFEAFKRIFQSFLVDEMKPNIELQPSPSNRPNVVIFFLNEGAHPEVKAKACLGIRSFFIFFQYAFKNEHSNSSYLLKGRQYWYIDFSSLKEVTDSLREKRSLVRWQIKQVSYWIQYYERPDYKELEALLLAIITGVIDCKKQNKQLDGLKKSYRSVRRGKDQIAKRKNLLEEFSQWVAVEPLGELHSIPEEQDLSSDGVVDAMVFNR